MKVANLVWIFIPAVHTAAGCIYVVIAMIAYSFQLLGPVIWGIPVGCLALLVLDLTGRLSLRGSFPKTIAAIALPALLGCGDVLFLEGEWRFLGDLSCVGVLLLLTVYTLLRGERRSDGLDKAAELLEQGSFLGLANMIWLMLLVGAVTFMLTFGLLISLFIGTLIAAQNSLLDYGGIKGLLGGMAVLYVLQCLWYVRGARLIQRADPARRINWLSLVVPVWNAAQARRLELQIRLGHMEIRKDRGADHDDFGDYWPHRRGQDNPPAGGGEAGGRGDRL